MDDSTLRKFETLHIGSYRKLAEHEAMYHAESKGEGENKIRKRTDLLPEAAMEGISSTPTDSHQVLPVHPLKPPRGTRRHKKTVNAQEAISERSSGQPDQDSASPQQASNRLHCVSSQESKCPNSTKSRSQRRQNSAKASDFVPRNSFSEAAQSETKSSLHAQKASLSTKAGAVNLTLPIRSRRLAGLPPQISEAFSSSSVNCESHSIEKRRSPKKQEVIRKIKNSDELIHIPPPEPTKGYATKANTQPNRLKTPQSLLLVLDLNGTLLFRTTRSTHHVPRPGLEKFLEYCFANHDVLIWSSARPHNVDGLCKKVFTPVQQSLLLGQWGRDTLGLNPEQYQQRVQVYKNLDIVWSASKIQSRHPSFAIGDRWGQENTVLIDDSALKGAAQPFNLVKIPEFVKVDDSIETGSQVLEQVQSKLEDLRRWDNVSAFTRAQQDDSLAGIE